MGDPKYQYPNRWAEVGSLLFPNPTPEQRKGLWLLEDKDRDAEDRWGTSTGGGASIVDVEYGTHNVTLVPPDGVYSQSDIGTSAVLVPSDPAFDYFVETRASFTAQFSPTSDCDVFFKGWADTPGLGDGTPEPWGFAKTWAALAGDDCSLSGFSSRISQVPADGIGTDWETTSYIEWSCSDTSLEVTFDTRMSAVVIAIPNG